MIHHARIHPFPGMSIPLSATLYGRVSQGRSSLSKVKLTRRLFVEEQGSSCRSISHLYESNVPMTAGQAGYRPRVPAAIAGLVQEGRSSSIRNAGFHFAPG